ncbi:MAG: hypothetical protein HC876_06815 [Chloroflexaceae bacterium]|nr:hypothetical protein [Chloroflexaceae bacterium]
MAEPIHHDLHSTLAPPADAAAPPAATAVRPALRRERLVLVAVLLLAFVQGITYLLLLPPWQHYDEPSHFEYAWLIAHDGYNWQTRDIVRTQPANQQRRNLRLQIRDSMIEHGFYRDIGLPNLDAQRVSIGFPAFEHPPTYYAVVSIPLRFVAGADFATQLYVARSVSLLCFVLTIGAAIGIMRELTRRGTRCAGPCRCC